MPSILWYTQDIPSILYELNSNLTQGLTSKEAMSRLQRYGKNQLPEPKSDPLYKTAIKKSLSIWYIFLSVFVLALIALNETLPALFALSFILIDLSLKTIQSVKSEQILKLQKKVIPYKAKALRNGQMLDLPCQEIVPGDIVSFKAGDHIPADCRLIESESLSLDESPITGRLQPVYKNENVIDEIVGLSDRSNMVYMGTFALSGSGKAIVVATGIHTEIYNSIKLLGYQRDLDLLWRAKLWKLANFIAWSGSILGLLIGSLEWLKGGNFASGITTALKISVPFIPTHIRALMDGIIGKGILHIFQNGSVVRNPRAVEALGTVTSICINQAAIFTKNRMEVSKVFVDGRILNFDDFEEPEIPAEEPLPDLELLLIISSVFGDFNFDDSLSTKSSDHPVSRALLKATSKMGFETEELKVLNKIREFPFDFNRKCMSAIFENPSGELLLFTKGDIESILEICRFIQLRGQVDLLTKDQREAIMTIEEVLRTDASQLMAVAYRKLSKDMEKLSLTQLERGLVFVGLISLKAPIDEDSKPSIEKCQNSGIRPILICDSDSKSAAIVAEKLGILNDRLRMITRDEMDQLSEEQYSDEAGRLSVYCGVSAGQKLRLINQLQQKGELVAMTGYGAYDVEPMRSSDLAISSANICSDITVHYSDMILLKSGFQTIVEAIKASRSIYNNLRKSIQYFLSNSLSTAAAILIPTFIHLLYSNFPNAFSLTQILWVNIATISILGLILNSEFETIELTQSRPHRIEDSIFTKTFKTRIIMRSVAVALTPIILFVVSLNLGNWWSVPNEEVKLKASTSAFTGLLLAQIILFFQAYRRPNQTFIKALTGNRRLLIWACGIVAFQLLSIYMPVLNSIFDTHPLTFEWIPVVLTLILLYATLNF